MKISIVIPKRNNRQYYQMAIDSFLAQTEKPFEILLSENHSTDGSFEEVLRKFGANSQIKLVIPPQPLDTYSKSVSFAVENASADADYICIAGSDDFWNPNFIREMNKALEYHKRLQPNLIYCDRFLFSEELGVFDCSASLRKPLIVSGIEAFDFYSRGCSYSISGALFKTTLIKKLAREFSWASNVSDFFFSMEAARLGVVVYFPKQLFSYRVHSLSTTTIVGNIEKAPVEKPLHSYHLYLKSVGDPLSSEKIRRKLNDFKIEGIEPIKSTWFYGKVAKSIRLIFAKAGLTFFIITYYNYFLNVVKGASTRRYDLEQ